MRYSLLLLSLIFFNTLLAQESKRLDSLLLVLKTEKSDTARISILQRIGLEYKKTDIKKALEYTQQSRVLSIKAKDVNKLGTAYLNIGDIYHLHDSLNLALDFTNKAAGIFSKINNNKKLAYAYNNLGMIYEDMYDKPKAIDYYLKSLNLKEQEKDTVTIGTSLSNIGVFYAREGNQTKAEEYFNKALKFYIIVNDSIGLAKGYNNLGILFKNKGNYNKALEYHYKSLEVKEKTGNQMAIPFSLENIGGIYNEMKIYDKALEFFAKALDLYSKNNTRGGTATVYNRIGLVNYELKKYDSAEYFFNKALIINNEINNKRNLANVYNNLGLVAKDKGDANKALVHFTNSLNIDKELNNQTGISMSLINIGLAYGGKNDFSNAELSLKQAIELSKKINYKFALKEAHKYFTDIYSIQGKYSLALEQHKLYLTIKDSMLSEDNLKILNELEVKYESEKKEKEILKLNHQKELSDVEMQLQKDKEQKRLLLFILGFSAVLIISGVLLFAFLQKKKSNVLLTKQKNEIETQKHIVDEKNKEILDSITYAKRIQTAILPPKRLVKEYLPNSFILYKPKDIVAGDFYWMESKGDLILFAAADCTGHGVPGAMVSVICNNGLNRSVKEFGLLESGKILDATRDIVIKEFEKSDEEVKDGMDISLCVLNTKINKLQWSGANNPLWIVRNGELLEYKADKQPIGKYAEPKPFTTNEIELHKGDTLYIFTDGYADQFGGEKGKKYKSAKMKEMILSIQNQEMEKQREMIDASFESWKGELEQVDDVCVIGVRV
ncbi:MAG: tetratricopeptide repeat protein [Bacteroidota bacterium]